ncbi:hypothetical protein [Chlorobium sp. N1]|uniref:hypothetical protein n=1 Tax=Chlorobium sp. N1 TaxID=2491138 RepID=UPI00103EB97F|nr:hypothetical protein [Chlorobium sp. N1]TCD48548.1 hypothetical protein E0L29_01325 [Chlorobium sp. N1]
MSGSGNILVPVAFLSWPVIVMILYKKLDKRLVPVIAYVAGWMFLPCAAYDIFLLKNTKSTVIAYGVLAGAWMFDRERLLNFNFKYFDLPMLLWCTAPFFSSMANGLGAYDGLSAVLYTSILWGIPYYLGRVYFSEADVLKTLAITIFIGGVVYVPFSWFELIMSPQLHRLTYGFHQHNFLQTLREDGGYRPMIYMQHGLMAAMWMLLASLLGTWLYMTKSLPKKILFIPSPILLGAVIVTFLMYQSMASITFFLIGTAALLAGKKLKSPAVLLLLLLIPYPHLYTRITGMWDGRNLTGYIEKNISPARAESLQFRFTNEDSLIKRALEGSFFGWGGYGRARVHNEDEQDTSVTDGMWIITLGNQGIYGLIWMTLGIQLPALLFLRRVKAERWASPEYAAPAAMSVFIAITMVDNLLNAMVNPIYMVFTGGILSFVTTEQPPYRLTEEKEINLLKDIDVYMSKFLSDPNRSSTKFLT